MAKKYTWVVVGLMIITMIVILVGRIFTKEDNTLDKNPKEEVTQKGEDKSISAIFYSVSGEQVQASFLGDSVTFTQKNLGTITLKQAISASGARYANSDESIIFWNKGDNVTISQNNQVIFEGSTTKPENNSNNIPKGKLPSGSTPPANASLIEDVTWVWQKTVMGDGKTVVPKKEGVFTLLLKKDGNVSLKTDCNGGFGEYKIGSDGVISFGPLASTMMYCEGSQESIYTNAISTSNRYMLDSSGNLVLLLQYDSGSVFFKKQ